LRKLSIDELPQLVNVIRGEMSLVGPRPALASEVERWDPSLHNRLRVRPGITGMWQVNGRSEDDHDSRYEQLDLYYVDNWSLITDLVILARTIPVVIGRKGQY
jgi:lipopolysaccharide/colanic/teichoic acid biosynthesis glycosyltransferase